MVNAVLLGENGEIPHLVGSLWHAPLEVLLLLIGVWPRSLRKMLLSSWRSLPAWAREARLPDLTPLATLHGFQVSEVAAGVRLVWEAAAAANGVPLALSDLELWHTMGLGPGSTLCVIHDRQGKLVGGFAVHRWPSRALPGHRVLRLERLGESIPAGAEPATVGAVLALARCTPRVLRVIAEVHDRNAARRARIAGALRTVGFYRKDQVRTYERTLAIDLQRDDKALLASFSAPARQRIRLAARSPLSVITIEDDTLIPQLEQIHRETYARTGAQAPAQPWTRLIAAAREAPDRSRIFGVMLVDAGTVRLVAFAQVLRHGTFAVYEAGGSTRLADRRIPLMYPAIWALIRWARDTGATWLDLGGITGGTSESNNDPLAGISEFKRKFGGEQLVIGEDWQFDIAPLRQHLVQSARKVLTFLKRGRQ